MELYSCVAPNGDGYTYIDIYVANIFGQYTKAATIKANQVSRPDVQGAHGNNVPLDCGFMWEIPTQYRTGHPLTIAVMPVNNPNAMGTRTTSGDCSNPTPTNPGGPTDPPIIPLTISPYAFVDISERVEMSEEDWFDWDSLPCRFNYNGMQDLTKSELFMEILTDKTMDQLGITEAVGAISLLTGARIISTRAKFQGATPGTSIASKYLSNLIPGTSPMRLPTLTGWPGVGAGLRLQMTRNVGRFIGRTIPLLGWGILAYDLYRILEKTSEEYQNVINSQPCS
ncbi:STM2901 family protein [Spirosoma endbachense]|uniref:Uncharacterized protein n=1 Tax=Spirosoma endbachense TaxID=2666025 RepID=A0A6P1W2N3_9BACT|nr:hypothetical protein [Spirosoma endbachense]QHV98240.1 hypothetical protein GJR95_25985 [Spirosoma endbachense]